MELKAGSLTCKDKVSGSLNRTFYGIESVCELALRRLDPVLIVPFMELKGRFRPLPRPPSGLNRTFYGIERKPMSCWDGWHASLNRTFYGIESCKRCCRSHSAPAS